jgi:O-antigen/teichoic acid export membrane protein
MAPLGVYSQAFRVARFPETTVVWAVQKVAFPTFSRVRENRDALRLGFLKSIHYLALVGLPSLAFLMVLAPQIVSVVFGNRWEGMVVPLQILCLLGMSRSVTQVSKELLMGVGRPDLVFKCNLVALPSATAGAIVGAQFGIIGVAVAVASILSMGSWSMLWLARQQIRLPLLNLAEALLPGAATAVVQIFGLSIFQASLVRWLKLNDQWNLACSLLLGAVLYLACLLIFSRGTFSEFASVLLAIRSERAKVIRPGWVG